MITVTTAAVTVATELQVNKGEEGVEGSRGRAGRGEEEDDEEERRRLKVGRSCETRRNLSRKSGIREEMMLQEGERKGKEGKKDEQRRERT